MKITKCAAKFPHEPHSWRNGFLWLTRHNCIGVKSGVFDDLWSRDHNALYNVDVKNPNQIRKELGFPEINHKHFFRSTSHKWSKSLYLTWDCDCGAGEERYRKSFYSEMLGHPWQ
jgi:hypothetical protein